jgi:hypothetical protein
MKPRSILLGGLARHQAFKQKGPDQKAKNPFDPGRPARSHKQEKLKKIVGIDLLSVA